MNKLQLHFKKIFPTGTAKVISYHENNKAINKENKNVAMEEYIIYEDSNGNHYVKGDIGGGQAINEMSAKTDWLWDYSGSTEEEIVNTCVNTGRKIDL